MLTKLYKKAYTRLLPGGSSGPLLTYLRPPSLFSIGPGWGFSANELTRPHVAPFVWTVCPSGKEKEGAQMTFESSKKDSRYTS